MVFPQYGYREYVFSKDIKHWCKMVNDADKYGGDMNIFKWIELYFWVSVGRVKLYNLPSSHKYWHYRRLLIDTWEFKGVKKFIDNCKFHVSRCRIMLHCLYLNTCGIEVIFNSSNNTYYHRQMTLKEAIVNIVNRNKKNIVRGVYKVAIFK